MQRLKKKNFGEFGFCLLEEDNLVIWEDERVLDLFNVVLFFSWGHLLYAIMNFLSNWW